LFEGCGGWGDVVLGVFEEGRHGGVSFCACLLLFETELSGDLRMKIGREMFFWGDPGILRGVYHPYLIGVSQDVTCRAPRLRLV